MAKSRYHDTLGQAIDAATEVANAMGLEVAVPVNLPALYAGQCETFRFETSNPRKLLIAQAYRMESGRYELTAYVS